MRIIQLKINKDDFDLAQIFTCGQCFRWHEKESGVWQGIAGAFPARVYVKGDGQDTYLVVESEDDRADEAFWTNYFDIGTDYGKIKSKLASKDETLKAATQYGAGIRILRQDPFEMLISFIISANNNIPRIMKCIETLSEFYGQPVGGTYAFPTPEALAKAEPKEISVRVRTGYRSPYIVTAASQFIERGGDISRPETYLGVGPKVCSCIKLFTGTDMASFPIDVWVRRLLAHYYGEKISDDATQKELESFCRSYFGEYGGYAQQYLFYYERSQSGTFVK